MKMLMRLVVAMIVLSSTAGSCVVAYYVGYAEGLGVFSKMVEPVTIEQDDAQPIPELQRTEMHVSIDR